VQKKKVYNVGYNRWEPDAPHRDAKSEGSPEEAYLPVGANVGSSRYP
jgi:hypothetical protein